MTLYKKCLILTIEALVGEHGNLPKKSWLETALILSRMKIFYKIRQDEHKIVFKTSDYVTILSNSQDLYSLLALEILYLINFKKKFSQKNINRSVENYFKILFFSIRKKINMKTVPAPIIDDLDYLTSLSLCNLYTMSQFHYDKN